MQQVQTEFLLKVEFQVPEITDLGPTPTGNRRIARVTGGQFEGPKLKGTALAGPGGDWLNFTPDGVTRLDVRVTLKTDDDALIYMTYSGVRHGSPEVMARLAAGEEVDPAELYFRMAPRFETGSDKYGWLNRIVCIGTGHRLPTGPVYTIYQIL